MKSMNELENSWFLQEIQINGQMDIHQEKY